MDARSSLSEAQREAAVAVFELGWGDTAAAVSLGVADCARSRKVDHRG